MGVTFIVSIGTKLSKEPQNFLKLLEVILGQSQQKVYYENIDKSFPSLITEGKISLVLPAYIYFPQNKITWNNSMMAIQLFSIIRLLISTLKTNISLLLWLLLRNTLDLPWNFFFSNRSLLVKNKKKSYLNYCFLNCAFQDYAYITYFVIRLTHECYPKLVSNMMNKNGKVNEQEERGFLHGYKQKKMLEISRKCRPRLDQINELQPKQKFNFCQSKGPKGLLILI